MMGFGVERSDGDAQNARSGDPVFSASTKGFPGVAEIEAKRH